MPKRKTVQRSKAGSRSRTTRYASTVRTSRRTGGWKKMYTYLIMALVLFFLIVFYFATKTDNNFSDTDVTPNLPNQGVQLNSSN